MTEAQGDSGHSSETAKGNGRQGLEKKGKKRSSGTEKWAGSERLRDGKKKKKKKGR